jgi:hypothetical protein
MSSQICGAGAPAREKLKARANRTKVSAIQAAIVRPLSVLLAALREIFDEAAYQRFLTRGEVASSPAAYADFLRQAETAKARRPRCC